MRVGCRVSAPGFLIVVVAQRHDQIRLLRCGSLAGTGWGLVVRWSVSAARPCGGGVRQASILGSVAGRP